jgi:two-component system NarL family sensor kinase
MECNRQGQVVWLSAAARQALGGPDNVAQAVCGAMQDGAVRFWPVLKTGDRVLVSAQLEGNEEYVESSGLVILQNQVVLNYIRLQVAERNLSTRVRRMRVGGPGRAMLQLERERQRLSRDLHTGVGQTLVAIRTQLEIIASELSAPPQQVRDAMERVTGLLADALEQVRSVSRKLYIPEWMRHPLDAAIRQLWDQSGIPQQYETSLHLEALPFEPDLKIKVAVYRAAQEAFSNLALHSRATRIDVSLEVSGDWLVLRVTDNGVGFDAGSLSSPEKVKPGIGLTAIREQAAALGGRLEIESGPRGTRLELWAPYAEATP